jgi:hypothetical protein
LDGDLSTTVRELYAPASKAMLASSWGVCVLISSDLLLFM